MGYSGETGREENNEAERAFKKAGSTAGRAISNSAPGKAVKKAVKRAILPVIGVILLLLMGTIMLIGVVNFALAVKEGFVNAVWNAFAQISEYDQPRLEAWNNGGDPDQTALIYQQIVSVNNAGEPLYLEEHGTNEAIESLSVNSMWRDVMRNEHVMLAQDDMKYILQRAYDKNNEMFRIKHTHYTYEQWELKEIPAAPGGTPRWDLSKNSNKSTETSNEDHIYDNLTREHIEGEEDANGDKKFASHWQDAYALAYFYNMENMDNWGNSEESTYDPRDHGIKGKEVLDVNNTDGYYITNADLRMVCDLFEYNFTYYWDEILSSSQNYMFSTYKGGGYTTGYRYRRLEDPDVTGPFAHKEDYRRGNQNLNNPYEYLSYPDHLAYDETTLPFTQFTPESCPNTIANTIESYKYVYTPIYADSTISADKLPKLVPADETPEGETPMVPGGEGDPAITGPFPEASLVHLDEAGMTDYTPDAENFQPPNGDYCIGRWHVVDPREFIDTMAILCPWYKGRSEGTEGEKWVKQSGYNWVQEMIDHYNLYLSLLPGTSDHTISRMDYFDHIAKLYINKEIEVYYEGTKYEGMEEYYENLKNRLLHPDKKIYVAINIDGTLDKSKGAEATETLRPGVVNAFKWMESQGMKYVILTAAVDVDKKKEWVQTNILSKLSDTSGYKGLYRVTRKERYNYCRSHKIDILVDDCPNVITAAAKHMPVIEVHCSDWESQPSGAHIYEIDDFTQFKAAVNNASSALPGAEDYSGWTIKYYEDNVKDGFYNYQQKPESKKYPFYSYGVTYHNKEEKHIPENPYGDEEGDDDPGDDGPLPDVPPGDPENQVYVYQHGGHIVDGWFYIYPGADEPLDTGHYYSESQIYAMLANLEGRSGGKIDFTSATADVYAWNQSTGADFAAMCAIIVTEGGDQSRHGVDHWNFFDFTAHGSESTYSGSHPWWDAKADCASVGDALVRAMNKIIHNYWAKGQNTFYKMCWNGYGYPQSREEAKARDPYFSHCYCPWWEDTGYTTTGYNSSYAWCNKNAQRTAQFAALGG